MEGFSALHRIASLLVVSSISLLLSPGDAQISTPCTTSMISSFTPCFNFITGSSANGASPSSSCCDSFKSLMRTSLDCTCLVVTANVPIPVPINSTLALSLPQACNGGVPLQCKAAGSPLPAPGPVLLRPSPPPAAASPHVALSPHTHSAPAPSPSFSPQASKAIATLPPPAEAPAPETDSAMDLTPASPPAEEPAGPARIPGIRPVVNPTSRAHPSSISLPPLVLFILSGAVVF